MTSLNVIRTLTVKAQTEGVTQTTAEMKGLQAGHEGVAKAAANTATVTDTAAKSQLSLADAVAKSERRFDSALRAQQDFEKVQRQLNAAVAQNPALADRANVVLQQAAMHYGQATFGAKAFAAATSGVNAQVVALAAGAGPVGTFLAALGPWGIAAAASVTLLGKAWDSWADTVTTKEKSLEDVMTEHARLVGLVKEQYGAAADEAARLVQQSSAVTKLQMQQNESDLRQKLQQAAQGSLGGFTTTGFAIDVQGMMATADGTRQASAAFKAFNVEIAAYVKSIENGAPDARGFHEAIARLTALRPELTATGAALVAATTPSADIQRSIDQINGLKNAVQGYTEATAQAGAKDSRAFLLAAGGELNDDIVKREKLIEINRRFAQGQKDIVNSGLTYIDEQKALTENELLRSRAIENTTKVQEKQLDEYDRAKMRITDNIAQMTLEIATVGQSQQAVDELRAKNELLRAAKKAGRDEDPAVRAEIEANSKAYGILAENLRQAQRAQEQFNAAQRMVADSFADALKGALSGQDFSTIFRNFGKQWADSFVDAFVAGKGPLAGILGTAGQNGQQGGLLGSLMGNDVSLFKNVFKTGTSEGVMSGLDKWFKDASGNKNMGFGQAAGTAIGGAAAAYGIGYSTGNKTVGLLGGAAAGAIAGTAILPGIGTAIGAVIGGIMGLFGASQKAADELAKAQEDWRKMAVQVAATNAVMTGNNPGTMTSAIMQMQNQVIQFVDAAKKAQDDVSVNQLEKNFADFRARLTGQFRALFSDMNKAFEDGLGANSPFVQATQNIQNITEQLKGYITDTQNAFGTIPTAMQQVFQIILGGQANNLDLGRGGGFGQASNADILGYTGNTVGAEQQVAQARKAVQDYLLALVAGVEPLTNTQQQLLALQGTAKQVALSLVDLGMNAASAAAAVRTQLNVALAKLRDEFVKDLQTKINEATGKGYLNQIGDLVKAYNDNLSDAAALGVDQDIVTKALKAQAQQVIDSAQLTGQGFDELIAKFPQLTGLVQSFSAAIDQAAIDARGQGYLDRVFNAANDNSTLAGQLAAFDRQAQQQREAEVKAGGQKIAQLEAALGAERAKIVSDNAAQIAADQKRAADQAAQAAQDAADRRLGYRQSIAGMSTDTLEGALAAQELRAQQARLQEQRAGGEAMVDLEKLLSAEQAGIIEDFAKRASDALAKAADDAARAAEEAAQVAAQAADRALSYQNRLFAATNDLSTLDGQLAAFDRQAQQDRAAEVKSGGQALVDLEAAQAAERLNIIKDHDAKMLADQQQTFASIQKYLDNLKAGAQSTLSPADRLAAARGQFTQQYALAQGGDASALSGITQYAQNFLDASRGFNASSVGYQNDYAAVTGALQRLIGGTPSSIMNAMTTTGLGGAAGLGGSAPSASLSNAAAVFAGPANDNSALMQKIEALTAEVVGLRKELQVTQARIIQETVGGSDKIVDAVNEEGRKTRTEGRQIANDPRRKSRAA